MPAAPLPDNEQARLAELRAYDILDTPEEQAFDEIAEIASRIFATPIALVSLVDEARQYFKARVGLDATETHRDLAFCAHAILGPEVLVVEDAMADDRFSDNALVTEDPNIRFYAGAPLVTDAGNRMGTLCVIDRAPRTLSKHEQEILQMLANRVINEMRLRQINKNLRNSRDNINRLFTVLSDGVIVIDENNAITFIDRNAEQLFGLRSNQCAGQSWQSVLQLDSSASAAVEELLRDPEHKPVTLQLAKQDKVVELRTAPVPDSPGERALILSDVTELDRMRSILTSETARYGIVGRAPAIQTVLEQIDQVASLDMPVLISGETGTGKDVVANAIHNNSQRKTASFVAINCGTLTESLLGSQLFGHKRGAFTGAVEDQQGLFEAGSGGTVFLDEIGDMPMDLQVSLLRVLDNKEVVRLGETQPRQVDFRLISASNKNLKKLVAEGLFREDLYYRIRGLDIRMPALREHREDIPLLLEHFARIDALLNKTETPRFSANASAALMRHPWPGNVRELRSTVSYAVMLCTRGVVRLNDLPPEITGEPADGATRTKVSNHDDPREALQQALQAANGNRTQAAKLLGISRATLYRRMQQLGLADS
ncbi:MAG: sigma-54-dependent Fis family transcriptional regulator [Gammaproteobacteria bacterium]